MNDASRHCNTLELHYEMLNFAYNYCDTYNELCANCNMKMRKYEIEDYKWEIVRQLADIAKVIPAMNHIDQHLATAACNNAYKPCIQAAVTMGKKLLNKYYSYTYHSELYCIAMSKCLTTLFIMLIQFHNW